MEGNNNNDRSTENHKERTVEKTTLKSRITGLGTPVQEPSTFRVFSEVFRGINRETKKENVMSTTRPRGLPPKSREEELKHLKEYEDMLLHFKQKAIAEEEEKQRKEKEKLQKEQRVIELVQIWQSDIIPNWEKRELKKICELLWEGIPSKVRQIVWLKIVQNAEDTPTKGVFQDLVEKANQIKISCSNGIVCDTIDSNYISQTAIEQIRLDLPRTFPALSFFQDDPWHVALQQVLEVFVLYRPNMGYVQGMSYIAGVLLLNMEAPEAFQCMCHLLGSACHQAFYSMDVDKMQVYFNTFEILMDTHLPKISKHLKQCGIGPDLYLIDWILTIFTKSFPIDIATHLLDIYLWEGEYFLFAASLGILKMLSSKILGSDFEAIVLLMQNISSEQIDESLLFNLIKSIPITETTFREIMESKNVITTVNN